MGEVAVKKSESLWNQIQDIESRIMRRAYDIFRNNGSIFGKDMENWLKAEQELLWKPAIELKEKDNKYELHAAVAGVDTKDIKVEVTAEGVQIQGETRTEKNEEKGETCISEFQSGSLFRSIQFPKKIDPNKVKAEIRNGMLTVTAAIAEEAKPKKVEIHAA